MQLTDFSVLTFDCYGTLIDWESGIITALQPLMTRAEQALTREAVLTTFGQHETQLERTHPAMRYSELLARVHDELASAWGVMPDAAESQRFGASVGDWPAFADTVAALRYLKQHYKLVILSNIDRDSFRATTPRLGVAFDAVYTAEDIGCVQTRSTELCVSCGASGGDGDRQVGHSPHRAEFVPRSCASKRCGAGFRVDRPASRCVRLGRHCGAPAGVHYNFRFIGLAEMVDAHRASM